MENFRAHALIIDADALEASLPFGEQLGLTGEADLLMMSTIIEPSSCGWLARIAPRGAEFLIREASECGLPMRLRAVKAALFCATRRRKKSSQTIAARTAITA